MVSFVIFIFSVLICANEDFYHCYHYKSGENNAWCQQAGPNYVFTGGNNDDYPGCGDCWCCELGGENIKCQFPDEQPNYILNGQAGKEIDGCTVLDTACPDCVHLLQGSSLNHCGESVLMNGWNNFGNQGSSAACAQACLDAYSSGCRFATYRLDNTACTGYTACHTTSSASNLFNIYRVSCSQDAFAPILCDEGQGYVKADGGISTTAGCSVGWLSSENRKVELTGCIPQKCEVQIPLGDPYELVPGASAPTLKGCTAVNCVDDSENIVEVENVQCNKARGYVLEGDKIEIVSEPTACTVVSPFVTLTGCVESPCTLPKSGSEDGGQVGYVVDDSATLIGCTAVDCSKPTLDGVTCDAFAGYEGKLTALGVELSPAVQSVQTSVCTVDNTEVTLVHCVKKCKIPELPANGYTYEDSAATATLIKCQAGSNGCSHGEISGIICDADNGYTLKKYTEGVGLDITADCADSNLEITLTNCVAKCILPENAPDGYEYVPEGPSGLELLNCQAFVGGCNSPVEVSGGTITCDDSTHVLKHGKSAVEIDPQKCMDADGYTNPFEVMLQNCVKYCLPPDSLPHGYVYSVDNGLKPIVRCDRPTESCPSSDSLIEAHANGFCCAGSIVCDQGYEVSTENVEGKANERIGSTRCTADELHVTLSYCVGTCVLPQSQEGYELAGGELKNCQARPEGCLEPDISDEVRCKEDMYELEIGTNGIGVVLDSCMEDKFGPPFFEVVLKNCVKLQMDEFKVADLIFFF